MEEIKMEAKKSPQANASNYRNQRKNTKKRRRIVYPEYQLRNIHTDKRILVWEGGHYGRR